MGGSIRAHFAELWNPEDPLDSLWGILASPYVTMLLLLSLAVLVGLGMSLPQRPAQVLHDLVAEGLWLSSLRERYQGATDWLLGLGLFDIRSSAWLRGLLGLLAFNLVLGVVDLVRPRYLRRANGERRILIGALPHAETVEQFLERVKEALRVQRYRLRARSGEHLLYAERYALFPLLVYVGLLLVIAGLAVSERTAWWEGEVSLRSGQVRPLGHGTDLALRAEVVHTGNGGMGGAQQTEGIELTFLRADREVGRTMLNSNSPSIYAGVLFYASSVEPALLVQAQDSAGRNLGLEAPETGATLFTELTLRFRKEESARYIVMLNLAPVSPPGRYFQQRGDEKYVLVPSQDLSLRVLCGLPTPGETAPAFQVEAFRNAETSAFYQEQFRDSVSLEIAGVRYAFQPQRYAVMSFGQDYGMTIIFAGVVALLMGLGLCAWRTPQRVWLVAQSGNGEVSIRFSTYAALDSETPCWLESLVQHMATALGLNPVIESNVAGHR